jgi:hypothetical protein
MPSTSRRDLLATCCGVRCKFRAAERSPRVSNVGRLLAQGETEDGVRWRIMVSGSSDDNYGTMLHTEDADGPIDGGGMGGPKLWGDQKLNVYCGRNSDRGPLGVMVRCDPQVVRLTLLYADGTQTDLQPCGDGIVDGLRFAMAVVQRDAHLGEVVGFGSDGALIERFTLGSRDPVRHRPRDNLRDPPFPSWLYRET